MVVAALVVKWLILALAILNFISGTARGARLIRGKITNSLYNIASVLVLYFLGTVSLFVHYLICILESGL
jgi:hypothetical protein